MYSLVICSFLLSTIPGILSECVLPQPPQFGKMIWRRSNDVLYLMFSCDDGHRLKGRKIITCFNDEWNHEVPECLPREPLRNAWRKDLFVGDEPARDTPENQLPEYALPAAKDRSKDELQKKVHKSTSELRKRRKMRERRKHGAKSRRKTSQDESLSNVAGATRLNETAASQLDTSCTKKNPKKTSVKAPSIEHAHKPRYARSL